MENNNESHSLTKEGYGDTFLSFKRALWMVVRVGVYDSIIMKMRNSYFEQQKHIKNIKRESIIYKYMCN